MIVPVFLIDKNRKNILIIKHFIISFYFEKTSVYYIHLSSLRDWVLEIL